MKKNKKITPTPFTGNQNVFVAPPATKHFKAAEVKRHDGEHKKDKGRVNFFVLPVKTEREILLNKQQLKNQGK